MYHSLALKLTYRKVVVTREYFRVKPYRKFMGQKKEIFRQLRIGIGIGIGIGNQSSNRKINAETVALVLITNEKINRLLKND